MEQKLSVRMLGCPHPRPSVCISLASGVLSSLFTGEEVKACRGREWVGFEPMSACALNHCTVLSPELVTVGRIVHELLHICWWSHHPQLTMTQSLQSRVGRRKNPTCKGSTLCQTQYLLQQMWGKTKRCNQKCWKWLTLGEETRGGERRKAGAFYFTNKLTFNVTYNFY